MIFENDFILNLNLFDTGNKNTHTSVDILQGQEVSGVKVVCKWDLPCCVECFLQ